MLKKLDFTIIDNLEKGPIYRSLFNNGACLLYHQAQGFVGATVSLNFLAGSIFEKESEFGLAHLIEHLIFKETDSDNIKQLELKGAELNAYTYKENVCFEMSCLADRLEELLPLFFDVFFKLNFTLEQLNKEKKVVIQELNEDQDDHETQGLEVLFAKNFTAAIGHPVGGSISKVRSFDEKSIRSYHKKYFTPERMILTVVSGMVHPDLEKIYMHAMQNYFKFKEKRPYRFKSLDRISKISHFRAKRQRKMESAISYFSFNGPSVRSKFAYDYVVLDEILFEGLSSKFFQKFREEQALVYGLGSTINSFANCGNYIMVFNSNKKDIKSIKTGVFEVLAQMAKEGHKNSEIDDVKDKILDSWLLAFDDINERAEFIAENEIYSMHDTGLVQIRKRIEMVDSSRIKQLINKISLKDSYSELVLVSKGG